MVVVPFPHVLGFFRHACRIGEEFFQTLRQGVVFGARIPDDQAASLRVRRRGKREASGDHARLGKVKTQIAAEIFVSRDDQAGVELFFAQMRGQQIVGRMKARRLAQRGPR